MIGQDEHARFEQLGTAVSKLTSAQTIFGLIASKPYADLCFDIALFSIDLQRYALYALPARQPATDTHLTNFNSARTILTEVRGDLQAMTKFEVGALEFSFHNKAGFESIRREFNKRVNALRKQEPEKFLEEDLK
ncbi:hypothetical protein [Rhodococcus sp. MEB041]|uniref:hypothetical protein n=1 Tax=Rhodococcus sp. MEB041 TaxID=3040323 RepID=UPI00254A967E|nr:hypothetical protein [Rhodococcus sp. MEB041]